MGWIFTLPTQTIPWSCDYQIEKDPIQSSKRTEHTSSFSPNHPNSHRKIQELTKAAPSKECPGHSLSPALPGASPGDSLGASPALPGTSPALPGASPALPSASPALPAQVTAQVPVQLSQVPAQVPATYLYLMVLSCRHSPCSCRNLSSCFLSLLGLRAPGQPAAGLLARGVSPARRPRGLGGGMSAQDGLYRCMVATPALGTQLLSPGAEPGAIPGRILELGWFSPLFLVFLGFSPRLSSCCCNQPLVVDAQDGFWPRSAILFICWDLSWPSTPGLLVGKEH